MVNATPAGMVEFEGKFYQPAERDAILAARAAKASADAAAALQPGEVYDHKGRLVAGWRPSDLVPAEYLADPEAYEPSVGNELVTEGQLVGTLDLIGTGGGGGADPLAVKLTGDQTIGGVKTFSSAPVVPDDSFPQSKVTNLTTDLAAKAADNAVVKLTGDQTIDGVKTFSTAPVVPDGSFTQAKVANLTTDLAAKAADNAVVKLTGNQTVAGVKTFSSAPIVPDGSFSQAKVANLTTDLAAKADTTALTSGLAAKADTTVLTAGLAAKADDSAVVKLTGNQTIAGAKTFSSAPIVPDGSFTQAKVANLTADLAGKLDAAEAANRYRREFPVDPTTYNSGATAHINARINEAFASGGGTVVIPPAAGPYMIEAAASGMSDATAGIVMKSNVNLNILPGAELQTIANANTWSLLIQCRDVSNVTIRGGVLRGDRAGHTGVTGEWGYGIAIFGSCSNINIENVSALDFWGDGFNLDTTNSANTPTNITLRNVQSHNNRRQGISISAGIDVRIVDSRFTNSNGIAPESGADLEPYFSRIVRAVRFINCYFGGNIGPGVQFVSSETTNCALIGCTFEENPSNSLGQLFLANGTTDHLVTNNTFRRTTSGHQIVIGGTPASGSRFVIANNRIIGGKVGIRATGMKNSIVHGNELRNGTEQAILLQTNSDSNSIGHNMIYGYDNLGVRIGEADIYVVGSIENHIFNNHVRASLLHTGTAQAGTGTTITLAADASAVDDYYNGGIVFIISGTGAAQQRRLVSAYNGTTKVATVTGTFSPAADATSVYQVVRGHKYGIAVVGATAIDNLTESNDLLRVGIIGSTLDSGTRTTRRFNRVHDTPPPGVGVPDAASGTLFRLAWNGSAWTYNGAALTARPSTRTDLYFDLYGAPAATPDPAWMLANDSRTDV